MTSSDEELKELLKQATTYKQDPRHRIPMVDRPSKILTQSNKCRENKARKCSNCTCNKNTNTNNTVYKSKCGSCHLGDPFRCSSCPYKGLPPFNEGDEINFDEL